MVRLGTRWEGWLGSSTCRVHGLQYHHINTTGVYCVSVNTELPTCSTTLTDRHTLGWHMDWVVFSKHTPRCGPGYRPRFRQRKDSHGGVGLDHCKKETNARQASVLTTMWRSFGASFWQQLELICTSLSSQEASQSERVSTSTQLPCTAEQLMIQVCLPCLPPSS